MTESPQLNPTGVMRSRSTVHVLVVSQANMLVVFEGRSMSHVLLLLTCLSRTNLRYWKPEHAIRVPPESAAHCATEPGLCSMTCYGRVRKIGRPSFRTYFGR